MDISKVTAVLESPTDEAIRTLLHDSSTVFWINWRQEDETIAQSCESVIQSSDLFGESVESDMPEGYQVFVRFRDRREQVPLSYSRDDRHITLCALNRVLAPEYEVRFCIDSNGGDTLAFLPLASDVWAELELRYGNEVAQRFYKMTERPNLFTDEFPPRVTWQELCADPSQKVAAIKAYRAQCGSGMAEAKREVEALIMRSTR
jgi:hypothetical protein